MPNHKGKFSQTYRGSYMVKKAFSEGALTLVDMDGHDFNMPTNFDAIIQCFAWGSLQVQPLFLRSTSNKTNKKRKKYKIYENVD